MNCNECKKFMDDEELQIWGCYCVVCTQRYKAKVDLLQQALNTLREALEACYPIVCGIVPQQESDPNITWGTGAMKARALATQALEKLRSDEDEET